MDPAAREELRRLALWLSRRRAVDDAVAHLTAYGPTATDRVNRHLDALAEMQLAEAAAFQALRESAPRVEQRALPATMPNPEREADVVSLHEARARRDRG